MGVADDLQLERRARELARIDGRQEPESRDYRAAREELVQSVPEVAPPEGHEDLQTWDESPDAAGGRLPRVAPDDEMSPVELLIEEGLREADHDTRVAASEAAREEGGEQ